MNFVNCDFEPTYKNYIDASNEDLTDTIYRRELLSFFKCSQYNDTVISIRTDKLFHKLKNVNKFSELLSLTLNNQMVALMSNSNEINSACLTLFFSYDYFDVFLKCLQDYKTIHDITNENYNKMRTLILENC